MRYEYAGAYLTAVCLDAATCAGAASPILSDITYDALGRRKTATLPGGVRTFTYDDDGDPNPNAHRDLVLDHFAGDLPLTTAYPTRDALGNVLTWSSTVPPAPNSLGSASGSYSYDARNRLASWTRNGAPTENFLYDELGNLTQHGGVTQSFDATNPHAIASRPDKTYVYEGGNLKRAGNRHYTFDSADRMSCVGTAAGGCDLLRVTYDAAGNRVYEQAPTTRRGFLGPDLVHATTSEGHEWRLDLRAWGEVVAYVAWTGGYTEPGEAAAPGAWLREIDVPPWLVALVPLAGLGVGLGFAIRGGLLVGVARRPGYATLSGVLIVSLAVPFPIRAGGGGVWESDRYVRWVLADPLGSGVAVVGEDGLLLHQTRFKPFGAPDATYHAPDTQSEPQLRRLFAGHSEQKETQLTYMNARWQDPETGMFLSVDPLVADYADPQSYNAYSYARNNPVNLTDPTGMCAALPLFGSFGCPHPDVAFLWGGGGFDNGGLKNSFDLTKEGSPRGPGESGPSYTMNQNAGFEGTLQAIYDGTTQMTPGLLELIVGALSQGESHSDVVEVQAGPREVDLPVATTVKLSAHSEIQAGENRGSTFEMVVDEGYGVIGLTDGPRADIEVRFRNLDYSGRYVGRGTTLRLTLTSENPAVLVRLPTGSPGLPINYRFVVVSAPGSGRVEAFFATRAHAGISI